jgi:hypothetical protein
MELRTPNLAGSVASTPSRNVASALSRNGSVQFAPSCNGNIMSLNSNGSIRANTGDVVQRLNSFYLGLIMSFLVSNAPMYFATAYYAIVLNPEPVLSLNLRLAYLFSSLDNFFSLLVYYYFVLRHYRKLSSYINQITPDPLAGPLSSVRHSSSRSNNLFSTAMQIFTPRTSTMQVFSPGR